jgi:hypothetical protein
MAYNDLTSLGLSALGLVAVLGAVALQVYPMGSSQRRQPQVWG